MSTQAIDSDTVIFVPQSWDRGDDGGRVTTPEELESLRPVDGHPVDEMLDLAIEIKSENHLAEVLNEHFEGSAYSYAQKRLEYMERASDEKLVADYRHRICSALMLIRGEVSDRVRGADLETLREVHQDLQEDIYSAQETLDCAVALRRHIG